MSVPPTLQDLGDTAHALSPEVVARFDAVRVRMPLIAEAVNAFDNPTLQERAFYELVSIINPVEDDEAPDYHAEGVYCGEPAQCPPPYPGVLPGTPHPLEVTRDSAEPADGVVLEDSTPGGDVWARRDGWLPDGAGGKSRPEQRWYSLDHDGPPCTWDEMWERRKAQGIFTGPMRVLGPLVRNDPPTAPAWWSRQATDTGLRRELGRVDDREQAGQ